MKKLIITLAVLMLAFSQNVFAKTYLEEVYEDYYRILDEQNKPQGDDYITRGEFVAILMNSFGYTSDLYLCTFYDIYESDWEYKYIATAQQKNIAKGDSDHSFNSDLHIKVEDAIVLLSRAHRLDKQDIGEFGADNVSMVSEYAKNFVGYSLSEGIYPVVDGRYVNGTDKLTVAVALELMEKYNELENIGFGVVKFEAGYPKTDISGKSSSVLIKLKTDKPCTVYYSMIENKGINNNYIPPADSVDMFLTSISSPKTQVSVNINAEQKKKYDLFFVLKSEDGKKSGVYSMRNISVLPFTEGNGTQKNPYKIYSVFQFEQMRNFPDKYFELCVDIDYNKNWIPIGSMYNEIIFSGTLDGKGHYIKGLKIDVMDNAGLFAVLDNATVKNLYVDADVNGVNYVGVIAGVSDNSIIQNCQVSGNVSASQNIAGGIVGKNNGSIIDCASAVYEVKSKSYAGGIAGTNFGKIRNCLSGVERVKSGIYASSVSGINSGGVIENCVGASIEVTNDLSLMNGRITTNKENGKTVNNYAYQDMMAGDNVYSGENSQDGAEASWDELTIDAFYKEKVLWDFTGKWKIKNSSSYILPMLNKVSEIKLIPGISVYSPQKITNEEELRAIAKNLNGHYYLANSINLDYQGTKEKYWIPLGTSDEYGNIYNSFTGTFDARGYTIKNLRLSRSAGIMQNGLFGIIYGGTVRNLKLEDVSGVVRGSVGAVAGINYGLIENCDVTGTLDVYDRNSESVIGGICAINYTNVISCDSKIKIKADTESSTIGGVVGSNEGFLFDCSHIGEIRSVQGGKSSNVVSGGIAGSNYGGFIYNCYAYNQIESNSNTGYCGGIVGLMNNGEVYKCSNDGKINFSSQKKKNSYAYVGGISGITSGGILMNSFSKSVISADANTGYAGGISGFCENASIQNVYSINNIIQSGSNESIFLGGISGYSDNSYILGSVAINSNIKSDGTVGDICAYINGGMVDGYSCDTNNNSVDEFKDISYFFKPIADGGILGWDSVEYGGDVWTKSLNQNYPFPILSGVKNQESFYFN